MKTVYEDDTSVLGQLQTVQAILFASNIAAEEFVKNDDLSEGELETRIRHLIEPMVYTHLGTTEVNISITPALIDSGDKRHEWSMTIEGKELSMGEKLENINKRLKKKIEKGILGTSFEFQINDRVVRLRIEGIEQERKSVILLDIEKDLVFRVTDHTINDIEVRYNEEGTLIGFIHSLASYNHYVINDIEAEYLDREKYGGYVMAFDMNIAPFIKHIH